MLREGRHESGQAAAELGFDKCFDLGLFRFLPGDQRGDDAVFQLQDAALPQPLDDGVGGGPLPAQLLLAQLIFISRAFGLSSK